MAEGIEIYVPDHTATIQKAINKANSGDIIVVRPGRWMENIEFCGKNVTLRSELGPKVTIIDGGQKGSTVTFRRIEKFCFILEGFTITNGTGTDLKGTLSGGGILCRGHSKPTITGNIITKNSAAVGGGIACSDFATPTIMSNRIEDNFAEQGGAIECYAGAAPHISGNAICGNEARLTGGAIHCCSGGNPLIEYNTISSNKATLDKGGAIYCVGASPTIRKNMLSHNWALQCGGALFAARCNSLVEDNSFLENTSATGYGGAINFSRDCSTIITGNTISRNRAFGCGGAINCCYNSDAVIRNNIVSGNFSAFTGGGIFCFDLTNLTIVNNTIVDNEASTSGGGLGCTISCSLVVTNTILRSNHAARGPEAYIGDFFSPSSLTLSHSNISGGKASIRITSGSSLVMGQGNIDADPIFVSQEKDDFHITADSPCLNCGDGSIPSLPATDFEEDPRNWDGQVDIGADEFHVHLYGSGQVVPGEKVTMHIVGSPGKPVVLYLGASILEPPKPTPGGLLHLMPPPAYTWNLGAVSKTGVLDFSLTIPFSWPAPGREYPFQALIGPPGSQASMLTNLLILPGR